MEESKENRTVILREMYWKVVAIKKGREESYEVWMHGVGNDGCKSSEVLCRSNKTVRELASFLLYTACDWTLRVLPV